MAGRLLATDRQRITRALEVVDATGRSLLDWQKDGQEQAPLAVAGGVRDPGVRGPGADGMVRDAIEVPVRLALVGVERGPLALEVGEREVGAEYPLDAFGHRPEGEGLAQLAPVHLLMAEGLLKLLRRDHVFLQQQLTELDGHDPSSTEIQTGGQAGLKSAV